jgi:hypothetical protein
VVTRAWSKLGTVEFALSLAVPKSQRYQRRLVPVDPEGSGDYRMEDGIPTVRSVARWKVDDWSAGEGRSVWKRGENMYRQSSDVRPLRIGEGLDLGADSYTGQYASADLAEGRAVGAGEGAVWAGFDDGYLYKWNGSSWATREAIGSTSAIVSIAAPGDGYVYTSHADKSIRRLAPGGANNEVIAAATFSNVPFLHAWSGSLFALDGDDLYEITGGAPGSRTLRADLTPSSTTYSTGTGTYRFPRMTATERGPLWFQHLPDGSTILWEYNVFADSQVRLGKLPVQGVPYSIAHSNGFVFVGFRMATGDSASGDGYVYYQRGAQKGVLGPLRAPSGVTAAKPVILAGTYGEEILVGFDGALWGYTPSTGGIAQVSTLPGVSAPQQALVFGSQVFVSENTGTSPTVDVVDMTVWQASGTIDSGHFDFDYPGLKKILLAVDVETDPLPAGCSVTCSVTADHASSPTALTGTHNTTGARRYTFTASTPASKILGRVFEIRLSLATGSSSSTPTVRSVTARATGAAWEQEWVMTVDCDTAKVGGVAQRSAAAIDALYGLLASGMVTFEDRFGNDDHEAGDSTVVTVEDVILPDAESDGPAYATIRVRGRDLVEVT